MKKNILNGIILLSLLIFSSKQQEQEIRNLEPKPLWESFYQIAQIPHCSKKEKSLRENYIKKWAEHYSFKYSEDSYGNAVVKVPPTQTNTPGPVIVLQSHLDMVCEKNKGSSHDFDKDPILLKYEDFSKQWVNANETTLGADDAMGIALSIALANDKSVKHSGLELLFTVEEEIGLLGAQNLNNEGVKDFVTGTVLINVDSGPVGELIIGCAGSTRLQVTIPKFLTRLTQNQVQYNLRVTGLIGGHSGVDIDKYRANSLKVLARVLRRFETKSLRYSLVYLEGGLLLNALPRESSAKINIFPQDLLGFQNSIKEVLNELKNEYLNSDPDIQIYFDRVGESNGIVYRDDVKLKIISFLELAKHGVVAMSADIPDLVETSINLAAMKEEGSNLIISLSIRSSIDSAAKNVISELNALVNLLNLVGAKLDVISSYVGWQPNLSSPLLERSKSVYKKLYGNYPLVKAIHAGLEPGIVGMKFPSLKDNMLSIGPTIIDNHSPKEKVLISSVSKTYEFLSNLVNSYSIKE